MGTHLPLPKRGRNCQFSANVRCGQTAGWTKMPLGMEVGLDPGDFVFDGDPAPFRKKCTPHPIFDPCLLWSNGWIDQNATWYGGKPRLRRRCVRRGPSSPAKVAQQPPLFGPCLLWPRSPISATAELLLQSLAQISRLLTVTVTFDVKRRSLTLLPVLPKQVVVFNGQTVADTR